MHQIQFRLGSLQRFLRPPSWILREGREREGDERVGERGDGEGKGGGRRREGTPSKKPGYGPADKQ